MNDSGLGRLKGRVAIVTGSGKGIGRGIAEVLAREGASVVVADVDRDAGSKAAQAIDGIGGANSLFLQVDVTRRRSVDTLVEQTLGRFSRLDIMCHNAGIYPEVRLDELTDDVWDRVLDTNLKSALYLTQACLRPFRQRGGGRIVFTASITGPLTAIPGQSAYGASKAGLVGFVRHAALELASENITVNSVWPGNILTPGMEEQLGQNYIDAQKRRIPTGRLGRPEDIAYAMLFLASDEAPFVTGQSIIVDGGQTLPEA